MKYIYKHQKIMGIAIPVSAIRTEKSCGVGEFADLKEFALFCCKVDIRLIQILPVNDTGFDPTPYSAQTSLGLNPIYLRLTEITGHEMFLNEIQNFQKNYNSLNRLSYKDCYTFKQEILKKIFLKNQEQIFQDEEIKKFLKENLWLYPYAVYKFLKESHEQKPWWDFPVLQNPTLQEIEYFYYQNEKNCLFYVWQQYIADIQLKDAVNFCEKNGIMLKGDIPILMNEDSADVWAFRKFFNLNYRVGAPPDMFSPEGQNWGFPAYRWDELKKENFSWWKERIKKADSYFHAFRIDHVLGFFRIWQIPKEEYSGLLGFFSPASYIHHTELKNLGFDEGRIVWLSEPHLPGGEMRMRFGDFWLDIVKKYLVQLPNEDLYKFAESIKGEKNLAQNEPNPEVRNFLISWWRQKALLQVQESYFFPAWKRKEVFSYHSLSFEEKQKLEDLIEFHRKESEKIWEENALELLSFMKEGHEMLICAEDLGDLPECTPKVLEKLKILSLKVERWYRDYKNPQEPFIPTSEYPKLAVATSSVHDSSPLRLWWLKEASTQDKEAYYKHLGLSDQPKEYLSPDLVEKILQNLSASPALLFIVPIQDLLAMDEEFQQIPPEEERINIPGTLNETNWTYRMPVNVSDLLQKDELLQKIKKLSRR